MSQEYLTSQHHALEADVEYYRTSRKFILADDELNEIEMLRALVDNDIQRLNAQIEKDKTTIFGKHKDPEKKKYKINELESLSLLLHAEPTNYDACLTSIERLMADKKMQGKTVEKYLQQCLDRFPYDRLPHIEEMRKFLVKLDFLLEPYEEKKDPSFFAALKAPGGVKALRGLVTSSEQTIEALSAKDVYERFHKIDGELKNNIKNKREPLQLYVNASLLTDQLSIPTPPPSPVSEHKM